MRKVKVSANGTTFAAECGDLLLDAALLNGIDIPFDCRSGYCGTCRVRIDSGRILGGEAGEPGWALACQCRVLSNLEFATEDAPEATTQPGRVEALALLAPGVVEVSVSLTEPATYLPGQYYKLQFRGFPSRCYSATVPLVGRRDAARLRFHVRRLRDGKVSSRLGRTIQVGHRVQLDGPLGSAYLRPGLDDRLVLVASGTGFAPIWAIADAAMRENSRREVVLVVGARRLRSLYMIPALCRLARCPNVTLIPTVSEPQDLSAAVRSGPPTDHLPPLSARDIVYVAGAPAMVAGVRRIANAAGSTCFADPFEAASGENEGGGLMSRVSQWFGPVSAGRGVPRPPHRGGKHRPAWLEATSDRAAST